MWNIATEAGKVTLPERKLRELPTFVNILATQSHMGRKEQERLASKLCSMHLAVPGAVAHLYHIQHALAQGGWTKPGCCRNPIATWWTGGH